MDTTLEKREPPTWVVDRITKLGGLNRYGQPNFRVIWGSNRYHTVGGMFKEAVTVKDEQIIGKSVTLVTSVPELRQLLKYNPHRWHLERWLPPEAFGTREEWYQNTWDEESQLHVMGDFPDKGDYEHVFYLAQCSHMKPGDTEWCRLCQVTSGEYIPLEENAHILERQIRALQMSAGVPMHLQREALFKREAEKRQIRNKEVRERVMNAMRPTLVTNPSTLMDGITRCNVPDARELKKGIDREEVELGFNQIN